MLALPDVAAAAAALGRPVVLGVIRAAQDRARRGELDPDEVVAAVLAAVAATVPGALAPVLNATGVIVHTNLGRAPLSDAAVEAVATASGYVDLELDLATGVRSRRGADAHAALLDACPGAEAALVVNNAAAALVLATTALAGTATTGGREVVLSRGEFIEIGAGFRLSDLIASTGARIREVGTTNRTHEADYADAIGDDTGCVLAVHPSNYRVEGFTSRVGTSELAALCRSAGVPLVVDVGSGLLAPEPALPDEPDLATALRDGADLVIASGDKLLGGPQAGLLLGRADLVAACARHPLARAVRADKLTLAALTATVQARTSPVLETLRASPDELRARAQRLADRATDALPDDTTPVAVVPHEGRVGGGGGVGVPLAGWALELPPSAAAPLRTGTPAVLPRTHDGRCYVDPRCIPERHDDALVGAVVAALHRAATGTTTATATAGVPTDGVPASGAEPPADGAA